MSVRNDPAFRELAQELVDLRRRVDGVSRPQLSRSSLENGSINTYDETGQISTTYGRLPDGSFGSAVLSGPTPPTPTTPAVVVRRGVGLEITWDGNYTAETAHFPLSGGRLEVYVSPSPTITQATVPRTVIVSPRGGVVTLSVDYDAPQYVAFAMRAESGKLSPISAVVGPYTVERVSAEDLDLDLESLRGTTIWYQEEEPTTTTADLWLKLDPVSGNHTAWRYNPSSSTWEQLNDQGVVDALVEAQEASSTAQSAATAAQQAGIDALAARGTADDAAEAAAAAQSAAAAANTLASQAKTEADRKVVVYRQTAAPTGLTAADTNDLWIDTDDSNKLYAWSGSAWVVSDDQRIGTALSTAQGASSAVATKTTIFAQDDQPPTTGRTVGDLWFDTNDGNKQYVWGANNQWNARVLGASAISATARDLGATTTYRQATAPTGTLRVGDLWVDSDDNALYRWEGATPSWVKVQDAGIQAALNTANAKTTVFYQADAPATTGRVTGDLWVETDQGNRIHTWNGSAWTLTRFTAAALNVTARELGAITTYRQSAAPTTGVINGDFWIRSTDNRIHVRVNGAWVESKDTDINAAIENAATAQATADGKMRIFTQTTPPTGLTATDVGDLWIDTDDGNVSYTWSGTAWTKRQIGNGAIQPKSLVASDVVATGTVTAALLETLLVLTTQVVAGEPLATHARLTPEGLFVYRNDPVDGVPNEVIRLGTITDDLLSITDENGIVQSSLDETGAFTARTVNARENVFIKGQSVESLFSATPGSGSARGDNGRQHWYGFVGGGLTSVDFVTNGLEVGLLEQQVYLDASRSYWVIPEVSYVRSTAETVCQIHVRNGDTGSPTINSPVVCVRGFTNGHPGYSALAQSIHIWKPTRTGWHRMGLSVRCLSSNGHVKITDDYTAPVLQFIDIGPSKVQNAIVNRMGGGTNPPPPPPPATQEKWWEGAPIGWETFRGNGALRTDTAGQIVQGWDPSGYNGNGSGYMWFDTPSITGTVNRAELEISTTWSYYSGGGNLVFNLSGNTGGVGWNFDRRKPLWDIGGYQRGGTKAVNLPADWLPEFRNRSARAVVIGDGLTGTNLLYYMKLDVARTRLRLWYTN